MTADKHEKYNEQNGCLIVLQLNQYLCPTFDCHIYGSSDRQGHMLWYIIHCIHYKIIQYIDLHIFDICAVLKYFTSTSAIYTTAIFLQISSAHINIRSGCITSSSTA